MKNKLFYDDNDTIRSLSDIKEETSITDESNIQKPKMLNKTEVKREYSHAIASVYSIYPVIIDE